MRESTIIQITVEDGTMIEVKVDKAKIATFGVVHIFHGWLSIWIDMKHLCKL